MEAPLFWQTSCVILSKLSQYTGLQLLLLFNGNDDVCVHGGRCEDRKKNQITAKQTHTGGWRIVCII